MATRFDLAAGGSYKLFIQPHETGFPDQWHGGADFAAATTILLDANKTVNLSLASVPPANTAPVATADSYSTPQDTAKIQAAPGVLANDTDADSDPLTAVLDTDVSHGTLALNVNGGFTYTPTTGYTGPDSFTYHANDGTADSNVVTVSLTVTAAASTLRGWWQFENNVLDSSGNANNGTPTGTPTYVAGRVGQAISLNGTTQYVTVADAASLDLTTGMTLSTWIKPGVGATPGPDQEGHERLGRWLRAWPGLPEQPRWPESLRPAQPGDLGRYLPGQLDDHVPDQRHWIHVAATYDGTTIKLYVNGVHEGSVAGPAAIATNALPLTLGAQGDDARKYTGLLDDARVYSSALSASEILALASVPPANTAPVAVADSYSTPQDTAHVQAAPGVLANDTDADSNPLTAVLDTDVSHGTLALNVNGGFTYTPTTGYTGPDSFTYHANDGTADSNVVTVSLTVTAAASTLRGWWQFENNVLDSSGNANNGTPTGTPTYVTGRVGQAISLNGTTQYVTVADAASLDLTTGMTLSTWIKPGVTVNTTQDVISKATARARW